MSQVLFGFFGVILGALIGLIPLMVEYKREKRQYKAKIYTEFISSISCADDEKKLLQGLMYCLSDQNTLLLQWRDFIGRERKYKPTKKAVYPIQK